MALRKRHKTLGYGAATAAVAATSNAPKKRSDTNAKRRELYTEDAGYRELVKERARRYYRSIHPKKKTRMGNSTGGLFVDATRRMVIREADKNKRVKPKSMSRAVYTLPEAASALGKSPLTLKRWISEELIPEPVLVDDVYGYRQYLAAEVRIIADELRRHEENYDYLTSNHREVVLRIANRIEELRNARL
jgi:hypothetical protein